MRSLFRSLWPVGRTSAGGIGLGLFLLILGAGVELLLPWPVKWLVDGVFGTQPAPPWLLSVWPSFGTDDRATAVLGIAFAIVVLALVQHAVATASQMILIRAGWRLVLGLRSRVMDHLHRLSLTYHDRTRVGESLYRVVYDTQAAQTLLSQGLAPLATALALTAGICLVMWRLDRGLALTVFAFVPAFALVVRGFGRRIESRSSAYHERESTLLSLVQESLSSMRAVKAFTLEPLAGRRFEEQARRSVQESEKLALNQLLFAAMVGLIMAAGTALIVWRGAQAVSRGSLYLGDVLVFLAYLGMLYRPVSSLSSGTAAVRAAGAQLRRVFGVLATEAEVVDRDGARALERVDGSLELDQVWFEYEPGQPVLRNVSFRADPGQVIALVGRTGAGKTTLAGMLLRFYDPVSGSVRLDGNDLRELRLDWLRQQVSVVLQDPILFAGSIGENIAYGRPGATPQEVEAAARRAQAHDFITALPGGYDSAIGERGVALSGGQRQRLAIARAFLKNAPVLLLDEPTSALDPETESALLTAMKELMKGRTTVIIAHRLAMVQHADRIIVLEQGRVIDQGRHQDLLRRSLAYRRLYDQKGNGPDQQAI